MGPMRLTIGAVLLGCALADSAGAQPLELPDVAEVGVPAVKAWAKQQTEEGERAYRASGLRRSPSPDSWMGVVVYEIQVDRFNNGNLSNDGLNVPQDQVDAMAVGDLSQLPNWRHGGDIQGIRDRLGYLKDLGVQALWVTPLLQHTGAYHGYCTTDPTTVDPGFGTAEELRGLVHEAHEYGISVILDIVVNHLCDVNTTYTPGGNHSRCAESLAQQFWEGGNGTVDGQHGIEFGPSFFPPLRSEKLFNRCGANSVATMQSESMASMFGDFTDGMFAFRTDDADFQEIFTELHKYWIAYADLDGFRLDAAKHVTQDFLAYFSTEVRAYAKTLGKQDFFVIGEVAALDSNRISSALGDMKFTNPMWHFAGHSAVVQARKQSLRGTYEKFPEDQRFPGLPAVYNFNVRGTARSALQCFNNSAIVQGYFASEAYNVILRDHVRPQELWTLLEIHDWVRFLTEIPDRSDLLITAVAWLMTSPGSPVIYYGLEQGFNGHCPSISIDAESESATNISIIEAVCGSVRCGYSPETHTEDCSAEDSLKRQDMFASGPWRLRSAVRSLDALAYIGNATPEVSPAWQLDPMLPRDHRVFTAVRALARVRGSCAELAQGQLTWSVAAETPCGVLAFARSLEYDDGWGSDALHYVSAEHVIHVFGNPPMFVVINPGGGGGAHVPRLAKTATTREAHWKDREMTWRNVFNMRDTARANPRVHHLELLLDNPQVAAGEMRIFVREDRLGTFDDGLGVALCVENVDEVFRP
eukprot:CAMPEP_0195068500 /NCGR_PEP_ID=MMETSP0448-20130528/13191_1 /TAXON_ID=66468 /ORGANISM="Heterocapsa triquestra, Strain CCMP 448" /LENGTH=754 /DNA_ID=CAMNT_0040100031 /DNA_START=81 /DNA_END=2344 /DNA_ORIENTATION=+